MEGVKIYVMLWKNYKIAFETLVRTKPIIYLDPSITHTRSLATYSPIHLATHPSIPRRTLVLAGSRGRQRTGGAAPEHPGHLPPLSCMYACARVITAAIAANKWIPPPGPYSLTGHQRCDLLAPPKVCVHRQQHCLCRRSRPLLRPVSQCATRA